MRLFINYLCNFIKAAVAVDNDEMVKLFDFFTLFTFKEAKHKIMFLKCSRWEGKIQFKKSENQLKMILVFHGWQNFSNATRHELFFVVP